MHEVPDDDAVLGHRSERERAPARTEGRAALASPRRGLRLDLSQARKRVEQDDLDAVEGLDLVAAKLVRRPELRVLLLRLALCRRRSARRDDAAVGMLDGDRARGAPRCRRTLLAKKR